MLIGVASMALPNVPGSLGHIWGALAVAWGISLVAAAEWERMGPRSQSTALKLNDGTLRFGRRRNTF